MFAQHQVIFWGSYLGFPFLAWLVWKLAQRDSSRLKRVFRWFLLTVVLVFIWARFIEPQWITVHTTTVNAGFRTRVALIADLHLGLYHGPGFLKRVVERMNALDVDEVLIAGDFTERLDGRALKPLLAPLALSTHPVYAVRGNHDSQMPGPPIEKELREALAAANVRLLENESVAMPGGWTLVGLGDRWAGKDDVRVLNAFKPEDHVVVLLHNPDSALLMPPGIAAVTFAGHTHGGQIRIPGLYQNWIPAEAPFDRGWYDLPATRLFITSGVGESGVPLRFLVPPVIDVINFE